MKIIVLDGYTENPGDLSWSGFEHMGEIIVYDRTSNELIPSRIGDAEIVLTNKTPINSMVLDSCPSIRYIGVLATGYDVVDVKACNQRGVVVTNVPAYGTASVSQFAIALLLEICSRVGYHASEVKKGRWGSCADWCFWDYPLIELEDKVAGIIGFGKIGQNTGKLVRALGMNVLAYDANVGVTENQLAKYVDLGELLEKSDVIFLHCPLNSATEGIICKKTISKMKDGVIIINNARGPLIVEEDLADALSTGKIYAAGLDVVSQEPIKKDNPLANVPNCIITPHISWAPRESRQRIMNIAQRNLESFIRGNVENEVVG